MADVERGQAALDAVAAKASRRLNSTPLVRLVKSAQEPPEAPPSEGALPVGETAFALVERELPEPVRLCDPWAFEGLNIFAGRPKLGKTTLLRQKMAAAASAGEFFDSRFTEPVPCVFLSLEEGERLARAKFQQAGFTDDALANITLFYSWPRGLEGVDLLDRYLAANSAVRYVCVDSLTKFRNVPDVRTPAFMADYDAMNSLHEMTKRRPGVCVDVVHHTRKAKSEDAIDDISGTYGLTAAVDSYTVLRHYAEGALMYVGGRLWERETTEYELRRANQRWELVGAHSGLTPEQQATLQLLKQAQGGLSGMALGERLSISRQSAWERLDALVAKGVATKRVGKVYAK